MAMIRKRGRKWQAVVRRKGHSPVSKVFNQKADAVAWGRQKDAETDRAGVQVDTRELETTTVGDILRRYRDEVVARKRSQPVEDYVVSRLLRQPFSVLTLAEMSAAPFAAYRDRRARTVSGSTIRRELGILQHAFDIARREWAIPLTTNPIKDVKNPSPGRPRTRRLQEGEFERLVAACEECRNDLIEPFIRFAVETGMRRGEITRVRWEQIDLDRRTLHIPETKNGHPRTIPLTRGAVGTLRALDTLKSKRAFPLSDNAFKCAWRRLQARSGVRDFHFHDFRHEAISRFFEMGLSVPEVALISGHRDYRMLARYTHLRAEDVVAKLG